MFSIASSWKPHPSHRMGRSKSTVWSPAGTPRFYAVQTCKGCGGQVGRHPAGQFADEALAKNCVVAR